MGDSRFICEQYSSGLPKNVVSLLQHLQGCCLALVLVFIVDMVLRFMTLSKFKNEKARWFMLHSIVNFLVVGFSLKDSMVVLTLPHCSMLLPMYSWQPSYLAYSLHLYHFLAYAVKRFEDIVHHLVFVGTFGVVNFLMSWGPIVNLLLFFMTGIPGAIDYALLSLVKINKFKRLDEKRINAHINIWLRMPGLLVVTTIMYTCFVTGNTNVHPMAAILCICLTFLNGVYYMQQVVRNYENEKNNHQMSVKK
jgi:hypothetical protein